MTHRAAVARAPGKLFVAGEYAVVDPGNPAVLVAVDRYVTVRVAPLPGSQVEISSDLGPRGTRWQWQHGALTPAGGAWGAGLTHVVSAITTVAALAAARGTAVPGLSVEVESGLHEGGTKYGLGSSGAVTVATVTAVAAFCGLHLTPQERYRLAMLATAALEPRASGGDLAASTWGGWILYRAPDREAVLDLARRAGIEEALAAPWPGCEVRRLPAPAGLSLQVGWTGNPASTASLVAGLDRRTWRGTASHTRFLQATGHCVRAVATALEQADSPGLLEQIRQARRELARLDDEVGLGIFTTRLTALCDAAEAAGGAAKPSGAGGGDCGIALLDAQAQAAIAHVRRQWATTGVLPLPIRPAAEGNEE